jgi:uncharacterized protein YecA (UPF0149 family)
MPPNVAITRGDQNPYWKHGIKMSQLFLRVSLLPAAVIAIDQFWKGRRRGAVPPTRQTVSGSTAKVGRNDPCPCSSGKKYKRCCGT